MIVATLGERGGTGKATVVTNLIGMRSTAGRAVLLVGVYRQGASPRR